MKHIRVEGRAVKLVKFDRPERESQEQWLDLFVSDDRRVYTFDLSEPAECGSEEWIDHSKPEPVARNDAERAAVAYVFAHVLDALGEGEICALRQREFPLGTGDEWLDRSILAAIDECRGAAFSRLQYKDQITKAGNAARKAKEIISNIQDLLNAVRLHDVPVEPSLMISGSRVAAAGATAANAIALYVDELSNLTPFVEAAYPSNRPQKKWRHSLTRAFALAWYTAGGLTGDDAFRRIVAAAASAIECICASKDGKIPVGFPEQVDHDECRWINDALAFGEGAPWQAETSTG